MNILALDIGENCGWAISGGKRIQSGVWRLKPSRFDSAGQRFVNFKTQVEREIIIGGVEQVVYEMVRNHRGTDAAHAYGGYIAHLQAICIENDIPYQGIAVSSIQKHATGKGQAPKGMKKKLMFDAAVKKFKDINIVDDNQADALWLLDLAITQAGPAVC